MTTLAQRITEAVSRYEQEAARGPAWTFLQMTQEERDAFDRWLVSVNHASAWEAGTQERRFARFICELASGRYTGPRP